VLLLPLQGFTFWLAIANNIFAICGLAGVLNAHRELVIAFFAFNATQMVALFHFFIDMLADARKYWLLHTAGTLLRMLLYTVPSLTAAGSGGWGGFGVWCFERASEGGGHSSATIQLQQPQPSCQPAVHNVTAVLRVGGVCVPRQVCSVLHACRVMG
jgi:hypothetical protein